MKVPEALLIGYGVSLVIGHFVTKLIVDYLWRDSKMEGKNPSNLPAIIGFLERFFYTTSVIFNQFALVALVLGMKSLGEWKVRKEKEVIQRHQVQIFLIGALVSLMFGLAGGALIKYFLIPNYFQELFK